MEISSINSALQYLPAASPQTKPSVQSAQQASPQAANSSAPTPSPGSIPFETQLLAALLNGNQSTTNSASPDDLGSSGHARLAAPGGGLPQTAHAAIITSYGELTSAELEGQSAESLTGDLMGAFGSNGELARSDVEQAFLAGATAPAELQQKIAQAIDLDWNALSGGSGVMSATQLKTAISSYLAANASAPKAP